jgi:integrase
MPHFPKPFFKKSHRCWYVEIDRKQHNLGPDQDQAFERYHELMRHRPREQADCSLAVGVLDAFLEWAKQNKAPRTWEWYQRHCETFARSIPPLLTVGQLKKHHLTACLAGLNGQNSTTKNGLCRAVCRAFQWAEDEELILRSPFRRMKKPKHQRRTVVIPDADYELMLSHFPSAEIRDLLATAWETAARPQEVVAVEARHVDLANGRWVFPPEESKGKQFPRVVYLNETAMEITKRLVGRHPEGPLFRNTDGQPWNPLVQLRLRPVPARPRLPQDEGAGRSRREAAAVQAARLRRQGSARRRPQGARAAALRGEEGLGQARPPPRAEVHALPLPPHLGDAGAPAGH